ncbi:MAG: elongation factor P [Verrucomicrobia bacterium]|nr:elongation factor P [Verrucomicrobiota bacterium]
MYEVSDLRKGLKIEINGQPYEVTEFDFMKPGKGQAIYTCRIKHMVNGSTMVKTYRQVDRIDIPQLSNKECAYSYQDGELFVFMDEYFEQVNLTKDFLGDRRHFLSEDMRVEILFHNNVAVDITLPTFVEKEIIFTEPGARGNTATNVTKPAQVAGGYEIQVPLFLNQGDIVKIDTRTGKYADRVSKK